MTKEYFKEPVKVIRLWVHECERVLMDRMVSDTDMLKFGDFRINTTKKHFDDVPQVLMTTAHTIPCGCSMMAIPSYHLERRSLWLHTVGFEGCCSVEIDC